MTRNITALYKDHTVADLVRRELAALGISATDIHTIPDRAETNRTSYQDSDDELHDLHLPDDDLRTYQHCIRNGDVVVSVETTDDNDERIGRIQQIMRRPEAEARQLDARSNDSLGQPIYPHSNPDRATPSDEDLASRDPNYPDPYVRSYRRGVL